MLCVTDMRNEQLTRNSKEMGLQIAFCSPHKNQNNPLQVFPKAQISALMQTLQQARCVCFSGH